MPRLVAQQPLVAVDHPAAWPKAAVKAPKAVERALTGRLRTCYRPKNLIQQRDLPTITLQTQLQDAFLTTGCFPKNMNVK